MLSGTLIVVQSSALLSSAALAATEMQNARRVQRITMTNSKTLTKPQVSPIVIIDTYSSGSWRQASI